MAREYVCKIVRSQNAKDEKEAARKFIAGLKPGRIVPVEVKTADGKQEFTFFVTIGGKA